jgi:hypothetical protein
MRLIQRVGTIEARSLITKIIPTILQNDTSNVDLLSERQRFHNRKSATCGVNTLQ